MLIRTQDKMGLVNALEIHVSNELGKKKFYVYAKYAATTTFSNNQVCIATYSSEAEVKTELDEISNFFALHPNGIYEMR